MMRRHLLARSVIIINFCLTISAEPEEHEHASSAVVENFDATDTRALEMFRQLAEREHAIIGVSGTLVGSDHTLISVSLSHTTIKEVLNTITAMDPRYSWRDMPHGTIEVSIGQHPLDELLNITVHNWNLGRTLRYEVTNKLADLGEIKNWLRSQSCTMSEFFVASPPTEVWDIKAHAADESLRSVLNEIARQTGTYFWSAIKYSENPCAISLRP